MKTIISFATLNFLLLGTVRAEVNLDSLVGRYGHYDIVAYTGKFLGPLKMRSLEINFVSQNTNRTSHLKPKSQMS